MTELFSTRRRILMVDDDGHLRTALALMLTRAGYEVEHAVNGDEALKLHQRESFDLIIAELILSDKDGFETLRELRRASTQPKFIAMSEGSRVSAGLYLRMAESLGAHYVMAKPFTSEQLLAAVRKLLGEV